MNVTETNICKFSTLGPGSGAHCDVEIQISLIMTTAEVKLPILQTYIIVNLKNWITFQLKLLNIC